MSSTSKHAIVRALSHRNFALFIGGLLPNYMTSWIMRVGFGWLAWQLTESPAWLGIIAAADLAPMLVLAPFAGAIADRIEPLWLIRLSQVLLFIHAVILLVLTIFDLVRIETLFVLAFYAGCVFPFHSAARQSIIPSTVPRELYSSAVAFDSVCFHSNRFIGPAIAAVLIPVWGVTGAFLTHAVGSCLSVLAFAFLRLPPPDRSQRSRSNLLADVGATFTYAWSHAAIRPLLLILFLASTLVRPLQDLLPGFADKVFHGDATTLALLTSAMGVGAMAGALHVAIRGSAGGLTFMAMSGYLATSLGALLFTMSGNVGIGMFFALMTGYGLNIMSTAVQALMQLAVDDHFRGRVMSLYLLLYRGTPAIGSVAIGAMAEAFGLSAGVAAAAILCLVLFVAIAPGYRAIVNALETRSGR